MLSSSTRLRRRSAAMCLMVAMVLTMVGGHTIASAHPDPQHESSAAGEGLGVEVLSGPAGLAEFLPAFQWAGTPTITDDVNLEGELAYVPGGCTPFSYADADVEGKIALVDQAASNEANPCPPSTFFRTSPPSTSSGPPKWTRTATRSPCQTTPPRCAMR